MKAYTDIEQSRKLAEILPIESADMKILPFGIDIKRRVVPVDDIAVLNREDEIPCWSLAALLDVLPMRIDNGRHCLVLSPSGEIDWLCCYEDYKGNLLTACYADNQVDACVEMIYKLKETGLL